MIDDTSLFLHVLAAAVMVGGGVAQVLAGSRVRAAQTGDQLVAWTGFTRQAGWLIAAAAAVSLMTGGHLAGAVWTTEDVSGFSYPFITIGMLGLVLLAPIGPMVGGARLRRLAASAATAGSAQIGESLRAEASSAGVWGPVHSLLGVAVGLVALMTYKPDWPVAVVLLLVSFAAGWAVGFGVARTR